MFSLWSRYILVHLRGVHAGSTVPLLPRADLHPNHPDRHPVLGVLLDRRDSCPCARHTRDPYHPHDDVTEYRHQPATATCLLRQGELVAVLARASLSSQNYGTCIRCVLLLHACWCKDKYKLITHYGAIFVERNGSGVELRTLD